MDPLIPTRAPAPDFTLPDLTGVQHTLSDYLGRVVILNFWSAECPWAARADAALQPLLPAWGDLVALLAIAANANESPEQLAAAATDRQMPLVLQDVNRDVADLYGAETTPHFYVIDSEGILQYQGALDDVTFRQRNPRQHYLKSAVEAVLAGESPNPDRTPPYGCALVRFPS